MISGFSFYLLIYYFIKLINENISDENISDWFKENVPGKSISIFLFIIAFVFYFLWFSKNVLAIMNQKLPNSIVENGLLTNSVNALDIAIYIPSLIITGV